MRTWFAHQAVETPPATLLAAVEPIKENTVLDTQTPVAFKPRRMIYAPVLASGTAPQAGDSIRIKAQLDPDTSSVVLMIDRPLLDGYSYIATMPSEASAYSPLALVLLEQSGVTRVLIHAMNITLTLEYFSDDAATLCAKQTGQIVRAFLESGNPVMTDAFFSTLPSEDAIRDALQSAIDDEISPGISGHSGEITLTAVIGNTAYIKMGGGCQGCAASSLTLRHGIDQSFRRAVPQLGALLDETDHSAGSNPFFTELPAEMRG